MFKLPIREVISPDGQLHDQLEEAYIEPGIMVRSGEFDGIPSEEGIGKVIDFLEEKKWGGSRINYKLRDWLISRQRYWGAPIPVIFCPNCGIVSVPEEDLPVVLPEEVEFRGSGESPLTTNTEWMTVACPVCGEKGRREVDTMDTFVCSSWYYLRFPTPEMDTAPFDPEVIRAWLPVDQYVGGADHAVMHLLYARFFAKALYDLKILEFDEPFSKLVHQGVITNQGAKMSKSRDNVVNPDVYIEKFGADVFRMFLMFMGSYTEGGDWSDEGIQGMYRFLNRVMRLIETLENQPPKGQETERVIDLERQCHYAIKRVTEDLERFQFNTSISRLMELVNAFYLYIQDVKPEDQNEKVMMSTFQTLVQLLAPFAPHLSEELWEKLGHSSSVFDSVWPTHDAEVLRAERVTVVIQVNGKLRGEMEVEADSDDETVKEAALKHPRIQKYIEGHDIKKIVIVKNKLVSIVVK
jgi:leucyl-tRNA synthetase